jgi:CHASE2 domain-containing sensor protein
VICLSPEPSSGGPLPSPYRGLRSFTASAEDAALFFGRDRDIELILANLLASRLTLLYGPSGVGKSSILCAGIAHELRHSAPGGLAAPRFAVVYVAQWHGDPHLAVLRALEQEAARLLAPRDSDFQQPNRILPAHRPDADGSDSSRELLRGFDPIGPDVPLERALAIWSERLDAQLLLVLDQFEQYFLHHPAARARRFDSQLAAAVSDPDLRLRCLISLREDALVELDRFKGEIPGLFENRLHLEGLSEDGALEAIRGPLERRNDELAAAAQPSVELEPGLPEEVVRQLRGAGPAHARGALPAFELAPAAQGRPAAEDSPATEDLSATEDPLATEDRATRDRAAAEEGAGADERIEPSHLQLVMEALWAREQAAGSRCLRLDTLLAMGGWAQIIRAHVDAGLDSLAPRQRTLAARAIRFLLTPSGVKIAHSPSDLAAYIDAPPERTAELLERLCTLRILRPLAPPEGSQERRYEVVHDLLAEPLLSWRSRFEARRLATRVRWLTASLIAAGTAVLAIGAYSIAPSALVQLERRSIDARFSVRGTVTPDRDIAIVDIDERTLRALRRKGVDSTLRPTEAGLIDLLLKGGPKVIVFDAAFTERGHESQLLGALARAAGRMLLVANVFNVEDVSASEEGHSLYYLFESLYTPAALSEELHVQAASGDLPLDPGGVYRRVSATAPNSRLPSVAVAAAALAAPHRSARRFTGSTLIDYHGPPRTFPTVSMIDVLRGTVPPRYFAGKIVLVGSSAAASGDLHRSSVTSGPTMPGTEIVANAISTVRHGPSLREVGTAVTVLLILLFSLVSLLVVPLPSWAAAVCFALLAAGYLLLAQLLFDAGVVLPVVYPLLALALAAIATAAMRIYRYARGGDRALHPAAPPLAPPAPRAGGHSRSEHDPRAQTLAGAS